MPATLSQSKRDSIRRLLETSSASKAQIARNFNCSPQTIMRINRDLVASRPPEPTRSEKEIAAKRELDSAFNAFERCNSRDNYRRLDDARHQYECTVGRLSKSR